MIGCLQQLQQRYTQAGSQLLILHANPTQGYRLWQQLSMPRRFSGIGMWNLIPNSAIALLWNPQEKGIQVLPKTGINCYTQIFVLVLTGHTVYTPFGATG